jgi:hypothetical protein
MNKIVNIFNNLYGECISESRFSWNNETKNWEEFSGHEKGLIEQGE